MSSSSWIVETLSEFFASPMWITPIRNFVDAHCIVFSDLRILDATDASLEDVSPDMMVVYNKYQEVADELFTSFCSDLGISESQLQEAISSEEALLNEAIKHVLPTLDNLSVFLKMMLQRNLELDDEVSHALDHSGSDTPVLGGADISAEERTSDEDDECEATGPDSNTDPPEDESSPPKNTGVDSSADPGTVAIADNTNPNGTDEVDTPVAGDPDTGEGKAVRDPHKRVQNTVVTHEIPKFENVTSTAANFFSHRKKRQPPTNSSNESGGTRSQEDESGVADRSAHFRKLRDKIINAEKEKRIDRLQVFDRSTKSEQSTSTAADGAASTQTRNQADEARRELGRTLAASLKLSLQGE